MSRDSKECATCGKKPTPLKMQAGKYGGIITFVLLACQLLDNVFVTP